MEIREDYSSFSHFITSILAIIAGIYSIMSFVDVVLYSIIDYINDKLLA